MILYFFLLTTPLLKKQFCSDIPLCKKKVYLALFSFVIKILFYQPQQKEAIMKAAVIKFMILVMSISLMMACQAPEDENTSSEESASTQPEESFSSSKDLSSLTAPSEADDGSTAHLLADQKPDIIFLEGFSNGFMNTSNFASTLGPLNTILGLFGLNVADLVKDIFGINITNQSDYAKWYFGEYAKSFVSKGIVNKVGYLHWSTAHPIFRRSDVTNTEGNSTVQLSQLEDNYDGNGSRGLITRITQLMNGSYDLSDVHADYGGAPFCQNGCIFMTHSTGGLAMDRLLYEAYQDMLYGTYGNRYNLNDGTNVWEKVTMAVEISSAAGGVEFAVTAIDLIEQVCMSQIPALGEVVEFIANFLVPNYECASAERDDNLGGYDRYLAKDAGVGVDLIPSVARSADVGSQSDGGRTPILHIAGNGNMMPSAYLLSLDWIISNSSGGEQYADGLVALHSTCGANKIANYNSCHPTVGPTGYTGSYTAPGSADLFKNHYPFMMTEEGHLSEMNALFEFLAIDEHNVGTYLNPINYIQVAINLGQGRNMQESFKRSFSNNAVEVLIPPDPWSNATATTNDWYDSAPTGTLEAQMDSSVDFGGMSNEVDARYLGSRCVNSFWGVCYDYQYDYNIERMTMEGDSARMYDLLADQFDFKMERGDGGKLCNDADCE